MRHEMIGDGRSPHKGARDRPEGEPTLRARASHVQWTQEVDMALQEKLDTIRNAAKTRIPPEARAIMERNIADLRSSGIMDRVARVGQAAPDFTLPNAAGLSVRLGELLARGPLVLGFYRGRW